MIPLKQDLSIYNKLNLDYPPVGIKYEFHKPEGVEPLGEESLSFCEMIKEAQKKGTPFYFTQENENCFGTIGLGMMEAPPNLEAGHLGVKFELFQDARANNHLYQFLPTMEKGTVNYVALSTLDKLTFDPDLLVLMAKPGQAEIVLRAMSYSTGEIWEAKKTGVLGCSWLFIYPYKSGKVNYTATGLSFGMKAHQVFPEGYILISIPYQKLPMITQNLREMKWDLPSFTETREEFLKIKERFMGEIVQESQNP
jgi:uncharacterized protein (DUF169 family)